MIYVCEHTNKNEEGTQLLMDFKHLDFDEYNTSMFESEFDFINTATVNICIDCMDTILGGVFMEGYKQVEINKGIEIEMNKEHDRIRFNERKPSLARTLAIMKFLKK